MFWYISLIGCLILGLVGPSLPHKNFRLDYTYNKKTDAFFKFHIEPVLFTQAVSICKTEGAALMVPMTDEDVSVAHGLYKQFPDVIEYAWVGSDGKAHESAEEQPLIQIAESNESDMSYGSWASYRSSTKYNVVTRDGEIKSETIAVRLPFFCKVVARDAFYDQLCKVFGKDYQYFENVGSCYKIPDIIFSWNQAYDECLNEGSHLVILNSELEHQIVKNLTNAAPETYGATTSWFFWAGIRARRPSEDSPSVAPVVFKTIFSPTIVSTAFGDLSQGVGVNATTFRLTLEKGRDLHQTLEETGYANWSTNEPNNYGGNEYCGSIFKNEGKYNDLDCSHFYKFVCEKEMTQE